jgi:hypothetical protein
MREKGGNKKYQYLQQFKFILLAEYRYCSIGSSGIMIGFYAAFCIPKKIYKETALKELTNIILYTV